MLMLCKWLYCIGFLISTLFIVVLLFLIFFQIFLIHSRLNFWLQNLQIQRGNILITQAVVWNMDWKRAEGEVANQLGGHWANQAKDDSGLAKDDGCREGEKRVESRHVLEIEPTALAGGLDMKDEEPTSASWLKQVGSTIYWDRNMGKNGFDG